MPQTERFQLGCTGDIISLDVARTDIYELLRCRDDAAPERTCVQVSTRWVPLCCDDVRAVAGNAVLDELYERLATAVERRGRRLLSTSSYQTVRQMLGWSIRALGACSDLMHLLSSTGFREGDPESDRQVRHAVGTLAQILTDVYVSSYLATPLLLMAVLVAAQLGVTLTALLQGRDLAELSRRGSLFFEVLVLIRYASQFPDLAQLLAVPTRQRGGAYASVLGCLSALAESSRVLLDWDRGSQRPDAVPDLRREQRKMASRVRETYEVLAAVVQSVTDRDVAAASAPVARPPELDLMDQYLREFSAAREQNPSTAAAAGAAGAGARSMGLKQGRTNSAAAATTTSSQPPSSSYDLRSSVPYAPAATSAAAFGGGAYPSTAAAAAATHYGRSGSSLYDDMQGRTSYHTAPSGSSSFSTRAAGGDAAAPYEMRYGYGDGAASAIAADTQAAIEQLRVQRELHRLALGRAAAAATAAGSTTSLPPGSLVRDGLDHRSLDSEVAAVLYPDASTSTLTYPWTLQQPSPSPQRQRQYYQQLQQPAQDVRPSEGASFSHSAAAAATAAAGTSRSVSYGWTDADNLNGNIRGSGTAAAAAAAGTQSTAYPAVSTPHRSHSGQYQDPQLRNQQNPYQQYEQYQQVQQPSYSSGGGARSPAGQYLGGYSVLDQGASAYDAAVPGKDPGSTPGGGRPRSASRTRMVSSDQAPAPSPRSSAARGDVSILGSQQFNSARNGGGGVSGGGSGGGGGSGRVVGNGAAAETGARQEAWTVAPSVYEAAEPSPRAHQMQSQQPAQQWLNPAQASLDRLGSSGRAYVELTVPEAAAFATAAAASPHSGSVVRSSSRARTEAGGARGAERGTIVRQSSYADASRWQQEGLSVAAAASDQSDRHPNTSTDRAPAGGHARARADRLQTPLSSSSSSSSSSDNLMPHRRMSLRAVAESTGLVPPSPSRSRKREHQQQQQLEQADQTVLAPPLQQLQPPPDRPKSASHAKLSAASSTAASSAAGAGTRLLDAYVSRAGSEAYGSGGSTGGSAAARANLTAAASPRQASSAPGNAAAVASPAQGVWGRSAAPSTKPPETSSSTTAATSPRSPAPATARSGAAVAAAAVAAASSARSPKSAAARADDRVTSRDTYSARGHQAPSSSSMTAAGYSQPVRSAGGGSDFAAVADTARVPDSASPGRAAAAAPTRSERRRMPSAHSEPAEQASYDEIDMEELQMEHALRLSRQEAARQAAVEVALAEAQAAEGYVGGGWEAGRGHSSAPPDISPRGPGSDQRRQAQRPQQLELLPAEDFDESGGGGMLVGGLVPLTVLHQRYAMVNPLLCAKLVSLEDDFTKTRRVAGDGNCFYRAALFALLEHVMTQPDALLAERLEMVFSAHLQRLNKPPQASASVGNTAVSAASTRSSPAARSASVGRRRASPSSPNPAAGSDHPGGGVVLEDDGTPLPPQEDPAAYRGGQHLLRLLRTAWFKAPDAVMPSDVSSLEQLFNHSAHSAEVIRFARSLTVQELLSAADFYSPFIPGCGRDYEGLSLRQICIRHVLRMGMEVEQLQIIALCTALGATVAVLDVAGSQVGAIKHGPSGHREPPVAWVAHLPGHYDVVYPAKPLDVAPGGALVPVMLDAGLY